MLSSQRLRRTSLLFAVTLVVGLSVWVATQSMGQDNNQGSNETTNDNSFINNGRSIPVRTVQLGDVPGPEVTHRYVGKLAADQTSMLSFQRSGRVVTIGVSEGDAVKQGDIIAELDQADLDAQEKQIQSQLAAAEATLAELQAGPREETIEAARARVRDSAANLELAKLNEKRQLRLRGQQATSEAEFDRAVQNVQSWKNKYEAAEAELNELLAGTRKEQVLAQEATCQAIQAQLQQIHTQRRFSTIVAPFDGLIARRLLDIGPVVSVGEPIIELVSHSLEAQIAAPPKTAAKLTAGEQVQLAIGDDLRVGVVDRIEPIIRREARTRLVYVQLTNHVDATAHPESPETARCCNKSDGNSWISGQVVELYLGLDETDEAADQFWLPVTAIQRAARGVWTVMVVPGQQTSGVCEKRAVEVLKTDGHRALVRGMVKRGERVIADGLHRLATGSLVEVVSEDRTMSEVSMPGDQT